MLRGQPSRSAAFQKSNTGFPHRDAHTGFKCPNQAFGGDFPGVSVPLRSKLVGGLGFGGWVTEPVCSLSEVKQPISTSETFVTRAQTCVRVEG